MTPDPAIAAALDDLLYLVLTLCETRQSTVDIVRLTALFTDIRRTSLQNTIIMVTIRGCLVLQMSKVPPLIDEKLRLARSLPYGSMSSHNISMTFT